MPFTFSSADPSPNGEALLGLGRRVPGLSHGGLSSMLLCERTPLSGQGAFQVSMDSAVTTGPAAPSVSTELSEDNSSVDELSNA